MMNRIMSLRVAAVALAAPALFALPAAAQNAYRADPYKAHDAGKSSHAHDDRDMRHARHGGRDDPYRDARKPGRYDDPYRHGYAGHERARQRDALRQCHTAIKRKAHYLGYRDVDFERDYEVNRVGRAGFNVLLRGVEVEDRYRQVAGDVYCTIRRGEVVDIDVRTYPARGRYHHGPHDRRQYAYR